MAVSCFLCPDRVTYFVWSKENHTKNAWEMLENSGDKNAYEVPIYIMNVHIFEDLRTIEQNYLNFWKPYRGQPNIYREYYYVIAAAGRLHNFSRTEDQQLQSVLF